MRYPNFFAISLVVLALAAPATAAAQAAGLRILARENGTGQALDGVRVVVGGAGRVAVSDSAGVAYSRAVPPGQRLVRVERLGYRTEHFAAEFRPGSVVEVEVDLVRAPVEVEGVTVRERMPSRGLRAVGFYERRQNGFGKFLDRRQIERLSPVTTSAIFRSIPGVQLVYCMFPECDVTGNYLMLSTRAANVGTENRCFMHVYLDGIPMGQMTPDNWSVHNIEAVEVYRRSTEFPPQFYTQVAAACGAVLLWTRTGG